MNSSAIISNYELLVKPILDARMAPNRTVIQGYFLTISSAASLLTRLTIDLNFTGNIPLTLPDQTPRVLGLFDSNGANSEIPQLSPNSTDNTYRITLSGARRTGLFLLQPNISIDGVFEDRSIEIRGLARIRLVSAESIFGPPPSNSSFPIILSAQQRGTFLPQGSIVPPSTGDYDQLAYSLPLATPSALVELEPENPVTDAQTTLDSTRLMDLFNRFPNLLDGIGDRSLAEIMDTLPLNVQQEVIDALETTQAE